MSITEPVLGGKCGGVWVGGRVSAPCRREINNCNFRKYGLFLDKDADRGFQMGFKNINQHPVYVHTSISIVICTSKDLTRNKGCCFIVQLIGGSVITVENTVHPHTHTHIALSLSHTCLTVTTRHPSSVHQRVRIDR